MTHRPLFLGILLATLLARPGTAGAAAVLIPDHTFRLGSCGGPEGPSCTWQCGVGKSCAGGGQCELRTTAAYGAALVASADKTPCGAETGVVLRFGLAGSTAAPFQLDTAFDLCARDVACTGREPRACGVCMNPSLSPLCSSDVVGQGNFPCPPDDVMFFCKDPCADSSASVFSEDDLDSLGIWFRETRQPFPGFMRVQLGQSLPSAPAVGRPVFYQATELDFPAGEPRLTHLCVRFFFTSQEKPLGTCSSDARLFCASDNDCPSGDTCRPGGPSAVLDNSSRNDVVSDSLCASGTRAGKPCATADDCGGASCTPLAPAASTKFCSKSLAPCVDDNGCPSGQSCTTSCPSPACGDGVLDAGEECDDGNSTAGDGCDASCHIESCWTCDGVLGQGSFCQRAPTDTPCDADGTPCTLDRCNGLGQCIPGGAPSGCAQAVSGKAQLAFSSDVAKPSKAKLKWKWVGAAAFDTGALGDPSTTDPQSICLFDAAGFRFGATAPAGGICGKKPCWSVGAGKVKYKNADATPDGLTSLQAKSGDPGKGKAQLAGKGANLVLPSAALTSPVQAYLLSGNGPACLQATYSNPDTSVAGQYKAKSD